MYDKHLRHLQAWMWTNARQRRRTLQKLKTTSKGFAVTFFLNIYI